MPSQKKMIEWTKIIKVTEDVNNRDQKIDFIVVLLREYQKAQFSDT